MKRVLVAIALLLFTLPVLAQDSGEESNSTIIRLIEDQLSAPNRQIRLTGISGALTSEATIEQITIADREGVWLRIEDAEIVWTRLALLRGRLEINSLTARLVEASRRPLPDESMPTPESSSFRLPDLPVAVNIETFEIESARFGADVFGLESEVSSTGSMSLQDGSLEASLRIERTDGPGGQLQLAASYDDETEQLDLDLRLREPGNGIIASLARIEGRPPVDLALSGSGPIGDIDFALTFDADDRRVLTGTAQLRRSDAGLGFAADLSGPVAEVVAPVYRPFFGQETRLQANGVFGQAGVTVDRFEIDTAQLSVEGSAATSDGFLRRLSLRGRIADSAGETVVLPVAGGETRLQNADVEIEFGAQANGDWSADIEIAGLATDDLDIRRLWLSANGRTEALDDADRRRITLIGEGSISGIAADDPDIAQAVGEDVAISVAGAWRAGEPVMIEEAMLSARDLLVSLTGTIEEYALDGDFLLRTADLAPFSGLAGQEIEGSARISARGTVMPLSGGFDLALDGEVVDLRLENRSLDGLLRGTTTIDGGFARNEDGFETRDFRVANPQFQLAADGAFATGSADFDFTAMVNDLSSLNDRASGRLTAGGSAKGSDGRIALSAEMAVPSGVLLGKDLSSAKITFSGTRADGELIGNLAGDADLAGSAVELQSGLAMRRDGSRVLDDLKFTADGADITGRLSQGAEGLLDGSLDIDAPDVTALAAIFLQEASGAVEAQLVLSAEGDRQDASIAAEVNGLSVRTIRVDAAQVDLKMTHLFTAPQSDGRVAASGVRVGGVRLATLDATANLAGRETVLAADATFATGANATLGGRLSPLGEGFALTLDTLVLRQADANASLSEPVRITFADDNIGIEPLRMRVGNGSLSLSGDAGDEIDLDIEATALPLDIANAIRPELGLAGTVDGSASVTGTREQPRLRFDARARGVTAAAIREAGLSSLSVNASGQTADGRLSLSAEASSAEGLRAVASGTVPLPDGPYDLRVEGQAPLSLADRFIEARGARSAGTATFDLTVAGPRADPVFDGRFSVRNGQFFDPQASIRLVDISVDGEISAAEVRLVSAQARLADGGRVTASGQIALESDYPANLEIVLAGARYRQADLLSATLDGRLNLTGQLLRDPVLAGTITIAEAEIVVPENFGGGAADLDVQHVSPTPPVAATLDRARGRSKVATPTARPSVARLDITIAAPRRLFVRGRGLDAELGGSIQVRGPVNDIQPVGAFQLIRGRLSILGERIVFDEGAVQLVGSLDPVLRFVATAGRSDITVAITVTGRASNPEIALSSQPALPQDEILALLIFNRGLNELSALQIARLAAAAAELAGSGSSLTGRLRQATGLDDIDIYTDEEGETAIRAGRYIRENIYLGVEAGTGGETRGTVNLDITDNVKAKGSVSSDGSSGIGLFFEKDY